MTPDAGFEDPSGRGGQDGIPPAPGLKQINPRVKTPASGAEGGKDPGFL